MLYGEGRQELSYSPHVESTRARKPGVAGVDIDREAVENEVDRLLAVVIEPLTQSDDLTPEVRVLLDQVSDALAAV